ncbi:MAG: nitrogen fixation protein NifQ [Rhodospirillaceae bacterium]|nr:MAG: nitrogen fixation protein NifQ [Rhodospirillaceae bacterium]
MGSNLWIEQNVREGAPSPIPSRFVLTYRELMTTAVGDPFECHALACALAVAATEPRPLTEALGMSRSALKAMLACHFPSLRALPVDAGPGPDALEEPDLRALLLEHRSTGAVVEEWFGAIIARRSLGTNHLWQDMGLSGRGDVSTLLNRHFHSLAQQNVRSMKWKKFFYRQLCLREDVLICKSPHCDSCDDFSKCFGDEFPLGTPSGPRETWHDHHQ